MIFKRMKKVALSFALAGTFILSAGFAAANVASAQDRDWNRRYDRQSEWDPTQSMRVAKTARLWNWNIKPGFRDEPGSRKAGLCALSRGT